MAANFAKDETRDSLATVRDGQVQFKAIGIRGKFRCHARFLGTLRLTPVCFRLTRR